MHAGSLAVRVEKEKFKFNCAHFVAFQGFRERLHGHNYLVGVTLYGESLGEDGYVLDFGVVKAHAVKICEQWNERFICPMNSDVLTIADVNGSITIDCEDGAHFAFPREDCLCLPIVHSTAEELAAVFTDRLIGSLTLTYLRERNISELKISVGETPNQQAIYRLKLQDYEESDSVFELPAPKPCLSERNS